MKILGKSFTKKIFLRTALALAFLLAFANSSTVLAHGWIFNDRAYLGSAHGGRLNSNIGAAAYEPQSVGEAPRNALQNGLELHQVITAGGPWNLNAFPALAEQTADRWHRTPVTVGEHNLTWHFTAAHRTFGFRYYITNQGWNPNEPLTIDAFEYLGSFNVFDGEGWLAPMPVQHTTHTIEIPADRLGYHIILGVWDVADVETSWFKVLDVEVSGGTPTAPTTPPPTPAPTTPTTPAPTPTPTPTPPTPTTPTPTPTPPTTPPQPQPPQTPTTRPFSGTVGTIYTIGDIVLHNGANYQVLQTFTHNGDPNWAPGVAHSLFRAMP
ncbi:MAG: lytic polysaccharide monooxygenase [Defluviitaleaceae bacterium]|nr:lytic polysaccharide monooxygenase [Defluviitaleaceae bacterium]